MAGYNLYRGGTGRPVRVDVIEEAPARAAPSAPPSPSSHGPPAAGGTLAGLQSFLFGESKRPPERGGKGLGLGSLLSRFSELKIEKEDLLLAAIFWILYKESGDEELLIIMGAMLLL